MKEYIKIQTGETQIIFKEFRIAYGILMPIEDIFRLDIDIVTYDGHYNENQITEIEQEFQSTLNRQFSKLGIKFSFLRVNSKNLNDTEIQIRNGNDEDEGLVALQLDWAVYLRNINIKFQEFNSNLYLHLKAESEDIDSYDVQGINTTYEMTVKLNSIKEVNQYPEIIDEGRKYMNLDKRYREILTKLSGIKPRDVELSSISSLSRPLEYNDSKWAWNQVGKTMKEEKLIDGWNGKPIDNNVHDDHVG
jgi:hypothetical protein